MKKNFPLMQKNFFIDENFFSNDEKKSFELLPIKKKYSFKWNKLVFEDELPFVFHDTRLNLEREQIFDLWENNFDIEKNVHINEHLQIHYEHEEKCLLFLLRIENINGVIQCGRHLKRMNRDNKSAS